jgi:hypothetical protein
MTLAKRPLWILLGVLGGLFLLVGAVVWIRVLHHRPPPGLMKDIRAGLAARQIEDADARLLKYLEERYGSMADPPHRREAFLDFFNVDHVKAPQLLVQHSPESRRQANIDAMARWVASFGASLTPEERALLNAQLQTEAGQAMLKRATAQYNCQDVHYRGNTAPVISQLLKTLHQIEQGN